MTDAFFEKPILNPPYEYPSQHWELDESGQPTNRTLAVRREAKFISPIPKPKRQNRATTQAEMVFDAEAEAISTEDQQYDPTPIINSLARLVVWTRRIDGTKFLYGLDHRHVAGRDGPTSTWDFGAFNYILGPRTIDCLPVGLLLGDTQHFIDVATLCRPLLPLEPAPAPVADGRKIERIGKDSRLLLGLGE